MGAWAALSAMLRSGDAQIISRNAVVQNTAGVCVFVNLNGAPSHVDTFDLKEGPWTPRDAAIQQYPGGIVLSRTLFPKLSNIAADLCLLRSIESYEAAHERGQFYLQTGHSSNPAFNAETPHIGAVAALEALKRGTVGNFPAFLALNGPSGQGATFLGGATNLWPPRHRRPVSVRSRMITSARKARRDSSRNTGCSWMRIRRGKRPTTASSRIMQHTTLQPRR
jgi:hypothetical protein